MTISCPKCLKDDQVQKVSAIVTSGTFSTTYNVPAQGEIAGHKVYGSVQAKGMGKTELAEILSLPTDKEWNEWKQKQISRDNISKEYMILHPAPPAEVEKQKQTSLLRTGCIVLGVLSVCMGASILSDAVVSGDIWSFVTGGVFVFFFFLALQIVKARDEKLNPDYAAWKRSGADYMNAQIANIQKSANAVHVQALSRFNMLYFCYRDDVVFLPETNFCVDSQEMKHMATWANLGRLS